MTGKDMDALVRKYFDALADAAYPVSDADEDLQMIAFGVAAAATGIWVIAEAARGDDTERTILMKLVEAYAKELAIGRGSKTAPTQAKATA